MRMSPRREPNNRISRLWAKPELICNMQVSPIFFHTYSTGKNVSVFIRRSFYVFWYLFPFSVILVFSAWGRRDTVAGCSYWTRSLTKCGDSVTNIYSKNWWNKVWLNRWTDRQTHLQVVHRYKNILQKPKIKNEHFSSMKVSTLSISSHARVKRLFTLLNCWQILIWSDLLKLFLRNSFTQRLYHRIVFFRNDNQS